MKVRVLILYGLQLLMIGSTQALSMSRVGSASDLARNYGSFQRIGSRLSFLSQKDYTLLEQQGICTTANINALRASHAKLSKKVLALEEHCNRQTTMLWRSLAGFAILVASVSVAKLVKSWITSKTRKL